MRRRLLSTVAAMALGGLLFNATPAYADLPTIDIAVQFAITQMQNLLNTAISQVESAVTNMGTTLSDQLTRGFTQNANYAKAQVGASQQITDASNTAMTVVQREFRNATLRDEHTLSPQACTALNFGQSITVASGQSGRVAQALGNVTDRRGQGLPGTPAYEGEGQAAAAITQLHLARYCSENEATAGLCTLDPTRQNLDQDASSITGVSVYDPTNNNGVNAANDFATNLLQPIVPASSRGDALTSVAGQDAEARRRNYNAKMSMARAVANDVISTRTVSVNLTADQKQQMTDQGLTPTDQSSWIGVLELDAKRRWGGTAWNASLQQMPMKSVLVEIATELAMSNYVAVARLRLEQEHALVSAALLASTAQADLKPAQTMPSPIMASP